MYWLRMSLEMSPNTSRNSAFKPREVGAASGHGGEGSHLVVALQIVHVSDRNAHAVRVSASRRDEFRNTPAR